MFYYVILAIFVAYSFGFFAGRGQVLDKRISAIIKLNDCGTEPESVPDLLELGAAALEFLPCSEHDSEMRMRRADWAMQCRDQADALRERS